MSAKTVSVLWQETIARRQLPRNLREQDVALFERDIERVIPATTLLEFDNVRISSEGILFKGGRILPVSFAFPHNIQQWKLRSRIKFFLENYVLRRAHDLKHDVLWVTDDWSSAYFHWLMDVMPRLLVMQDRLGTLQLLLPNSCKRLDFVRSTLQCFDFKSIEFIGAREVVRCRRVVMPSHVAPSGQYNEEIIRRVRNTILKIVADVSYEGDGVNYKGDGERIYISRARAAKRRIKNEAEIHAVLQRYGFLTVYAEDLSFEEQVRLFSRTRYLVSNHGAGLTNMLFTPQGASVLELRQSGDAQRNFYFSLASALHLNYFYQVCEPVGPDVNPHLADLIVDTNSLEENIRLLISSSE